MAQETESQRFDKEFERLNSVREKLRQINSLIDQREATIAGIQRRHADLRAEWQKMAEDDVFASFTPDFEKFDHETRTENLAVADREQLIEAYNEIYRRCQELEKALVSLREVEAGRAAVVSYEIICGKEWDHDPK